MKKPDSRIPLSLVALLAVALILGTTWSVLTPPMQAPDENSHVGYAQSVAERFKLPGDEGRPTFSTEQTAAAAAVKADWVAAVTQMKPEWAKVAERRWRLADAGLAGSARSDGGGPNAAAANPPLSYLIDAAAYRVVHGDDFFTRVWVMRMTSVLAFLVTVLAAWLLAGEVFSRDRMLQLVCAGSVALAPMIGFISASVSPDALLYALATLSLWLGARILRRGLMLYDALALGLVVGAACVTKSVSFALLPAALFAIAIGGWRAVRRPDGAWRTAVVGAAAWGAGIFVTLGVWIVTARLIGRAAASQVQGSATNAGALNLREFASYLWQFYLPRLPFQAEYPRLSATIPLFEYWVKGTWANFGWLEVHFSDPVYYVLSGVTVLILVLCIVSLVRLRHSIDWALAAFFAIAAGAMVAGLHWTEYLQLEGGAASFVQGRYLLPLAGLAGLAVALALRQFAPRTRAIGTAIMLAALFALNLFSLGLMWERFYA